ncbi:DUF3019 domain-containing protein [Shewanella sedimentimangrovi]|uniref:DUF3019 domain-containing protein n=1 Tax=Shewanella sedimentimangrovi TaxID=2814293 RepID=A0ABX7R3B9_9GAMM|nr:DUF3019 domain-containing protein [Shewanella sedimentimangrovi]QSX37690.1 DUF3019 domain-containing protein [Shewanella sedimentimangrovi]
MVKTWLISLTLLFGGPLAAEPLSFEILPRVCITAPDSPCRMNVSVSWQAPQLACLVDATRPEEYIHCADNLDDFPLELDLSQDAEFSLVDPDTHQVLAKQRIDLLIKEKPPLQERRLSWSLF